MHIDNGFLTWDAVPVMATKAQHKMFRKMSEDIPRDREALDAAGYVTLDSMRDGWWGPVGTPGRDRHDRNLKREMRAELLSYRVTRHLGPVGDFWQSMLFASPGNLYAACDALANEYLGDFLFWNQPITADYYESWVSRVHLPDRIHIHSTGPESECSHDSDHD